MKRPAILDIDMVALMDLTPSDRKVPTWAKAARDITERKLKSIGAIPQETNDDDTPSAWEEVKAYVDWLEEEAKRLRIGQAESIREGLKAVAGLRSSTDARIAELEKRLADASVVIEPFSNMAGELSSRNKNDCDVILAFDNPDDPHRVTFRDFRAARAYMEGK